MDSAARIEALEAEILRLRDRIEQLETTLGLDMPAPVFLGLTVHEATLFGALMRRGVMSKAQLLTAVYGGRPDGDAPEIKIIDVFVCKLRRKLSAFGIKVETVWGVWYRLPADMKARAEVLIGQAVAA